MKLTKEELTTLLQLLDVAIKAGGLGVAENALYFARKFDEEIKKETSKDK